MDNVKRWLAPAEEKVARLLAQPLTARVRAFVAGSRVTMKALLGRPFTGFAIAPRRFGRRMNRRGTTTGREMLKKLWRDAGNPAAFESIPDRLLRTAGTEWLEHLRNVEAAGVQYNI